MIVLLASFLALLSFLTGMALIGLLECRKTPPPECPPLRPPPSGGGPFRIPACNPPPYREPPALPASMYRPCPQCSSPHGLTIADDKGMPVGILCIACMQKVLKAMGTTPEAAVEALGRLGNAGLRRKP